MCDTCKHVHSRIKTSAEHTIMSIQDIQIGGTDYIPGKVISSVVKTYTTNVRTVSKLILTDDECIYLLYNPATTDGHIVEERLYQTAIETLKNIDMRCMDIVKTDQNEFVFSAHNTCEINILSDDGSTKPFIDVSSMIPLAKHFNQHGEFILGLREQDPALPSTQFSNRKVANFGKDNKLKFQVEFDKIGTQLFSYIWRITTDSKDNMYAIVNDIDDGRIEALNKFGELNFIYAGDSSVNSTENPFRPKDVVATQSDNILFTDSTTTRYI